MPRTVICCELATAHGGDVDLAADMIRAAADAGADFAKLQSYSKASINPEDPQAAWLLQAHLDKAAHEQLLKVGEDCGITVFSTPFDSESLQMLRDLGVKTFKVASSESRNGWYDMRIGEHWVRSWPWGRCPLGSGGTPSLGTLTHEGYIEHTHLTAIPLYPTPLECVGMVPFLDGWSDHCVGLAACYRAIAHGAKMVEIHYCIPGKSRTKEFDKSAADVRKLREFADQMATIESGVGQTFRERWRRA